MVKDVNFVENDQKRKFAFIQNRQAVEHVTHESIWIFTSYSICYVQADGRKSAPKRLSDDHAGS